MLKRRHPNILQMVGVTLIDKRRRINLNSFYYYNPTKLIFGKDSVPRITESLPENTKKLLLHYGGGSIRKTGLYDQIMEILKEKNIEVVELSGVTPNPKLSLVREGIKLCKEEKIDFILAVGGGSVIDSSKAIAAGVYAEDDVWDLYVHGKALTKALPTGVVLTIPASGSESSNATIITNEETKQN